MVDKQNVDQFMFLLLLLQCLLKKKKKKKKKKQRNKETKIQRKFCLVCYAFHHLNQMVGLDAKPISDQKASLLQLSGKRYFLMTDLPERY